MRTLGLLRGLSALAALTAAPLAPAPAQVCPWMAQVNYWQHQQHLAGLRQATLQHQMQIHQAHLLQQHQLQQQHALHLQQQQRALHQQQYLARLQEQQTRQQHHRAVLQQHQVRTTHVSVHVRRQEAHPPTHRGRGPHPLTRPHHHTEHHVVLHHAVVHSQSVKLHKHETVQVHKTRPAPHRQTHSRETSRHLAKPDTPHHVLHRERVETERHDRAKVRVKETPPETRTRTFFRVRMTCGRCHVNCTPPTPGLLAREPARPFPAALPEPALAWPLALQPGAPALPAALPGRPQLPLAVRPGAAPPAWQLPVPVQGQARLDLHVAGAEPGTPSDLLGSATPGGTTLRDDQVPPPSAVTPRRTGPKAPAEKTPGGLARPGDLPTPSAADVPDFLGVAEETAGVRPAGATGGLGLATAPPTLARPGPGCRLAVPPSPELPGTVLRLPDGTPDEPEPPDALAVAGPGAGPRPDFRPTDPTLPPLPDTGPPLQPRQRGQRLASPAL